jgi:CheY-like chemotaxis protein
MANAIRKVLKDGFSTLYDLRQDPATKSIPVILLTGVAKKTGVRFSAETVEEYMGERPQAFLSKPVEADELRRTARRLLGG